MSSLRLALKQSLAETGHLAIEDKNKSNSKKKRGKSNGKRNKTRLQDSQGSSKHERLHSREIGSHGCRSVTNRRTNCRSSIENNLKQRKKHRSVSHGYNEKDIGSSRNRLDEGSGMGTSTSRRSVSSCSSSSSEISDDSDDGGESTSSSTSCSASSSSDNDSLSLSDNSNLNDEDSNSTSDIEKSKAEDKQNMDGVFDSERSSGGESDGCILNTGSSDRGISSSLIGNNNKKPKENEQQNHAANKIQQQWKVNKQRKSDNSCSSEKSSTKIQKNCDNSYLSDFNSFVARKRQIVLSDGLKKTLSISKNIGGIGGKAGSTLKRGKQITVKGPTREVIEWCMGMSLGKQRRKITRGIRVKVRFEIGKKKRLKERKSVKKQKWYGGVVTDVSSEGKLIRIKYDDGTQEVADFPDKDIIVDAEANGRHKVSAEAFLPKVLSATPVRSSTPLVINDSAYSTSMLSTEKYQGNPNPQQEKEVESSTGGDNIVNSKRGNGNEIGKQRAIAEVILQHTPTPSSFNRKNDITQKLMQSKTTQSLVLEKKGESINNENLKDVFMTSESDTVKGRETNKQMKSEDSENSCCSNSASSIPNENNSASIKTNSSRLKDSNKDDVNHLSTNLISEVDNNKMNLILVDTEKNNSKACLFTDKHKEKQNGNGGNRKRIGSSLTIRLSTIKNRKISNTAVSSHNGKNSLQKNQLLLGPKIYKKVKEEKHENAINQNLNTRTFDVLVGKKSDNSKTENNVLFCNKEEQQKLVKEKNASMNLSSKEILPSSKRPIVSSITGSGKKTRNNMEVCETADTNEDNSPQQKSLPVTTAKTSHSEFLSYGNRIVNGGDQSNVIPQVRVDSIESRTYSDSKELVQSFSEMPNTRRKNDIKNSSTDDGIKNEMNGPRCRSPNSLVGITEGIRGKNSSLSLTTDSKTHSESVMSPSLLSRLVCKNSESDKMSEGKIRTLDQKIKSSFMQRDVNEVTTTVQSQDELSSGDDIMGLKNTPSRSGRRAVLKAKEKLTLKEEKSIGENFRRTKKNKREKRDVRHKEESDADSQDGAEDENWVKCDRCDKWRLIPSTIDTKDLPDKWFCELNSYDVKRNHCNAPEQISPQEAKKEKEKRKKTGAPRRVNSQTQISSKGNLYLQNSKHQSEDTIIKSSSTIAQEIKKEAIYPSSTQDSIKLRQAEPYDKMITSEQVDNLQPGFECQSTTINKTNLLVTKSITISEDYQNGNLHGENDDEGSDNASMPNLPLSKLPKGSNKRSRRSKEDERDRRNSKGKKRKENDRQEWVQCEKCEKWRQLPLSILAKDLPDKWFCKMNTWDRRSASCAVQEEKYKPEKKESTSSNREKTIMGTGGPIVPISAGISGKLSYRSLIFGTGRRQIRPISERTRAAESLFSFPVVSIDCEISLPPTVMYANSSAFQYKGTSSVHKVMEEDQKKISLFSFMSQSKLWEGSHQVANTSVQPLLNKSEIQVSTRLDSFEVYKSSRKAMTYHALGSKQLSVHEILLEYQCMEWGNHKCSKYRASCTLETLLLMLGELVKDGLVKSFKKPCSTSVSSDTIYYKRAIINAPKTSLKISKPWKLSKQNFQNDVIG